MKSVYIVVEVNHGSSDFIVPWVVVFNKSEDAIQALDNDTGISKSALDDFDTSMDDSLVAGPVAAFADTDEDKEYILTKATIR